MSFTMDVKDAGAAIQMVGVGTLDETTQLAVPSTGGRPVVIDCAGITRMNSMGVSAWTKFIAALGRQSPVTLRRLSPMMVTQASMITTFLGNATVESFFSPWVCPSCDTSHEQLHGYQDPVPESLPCPKCGAAMELDWDRSAYLAFRGGA